MQDNRSRYSMRALCTALQVSRSGYYAWCAKDKSPCPLNLAIERQFQQDKARAGAPSIAHALHKAGFGCSVRTVSRRMSRLGLRVRYAKKFKRTTDSSHAYAVAPTICRANLRSAPPIGCGWATSPTCARRKAGCTWPSSLTCSAAGWWAGSSVSASMRSWCATPCKRPCSCVTSPRGCWCTRTGALNIAARPSSSKSRVSRPHKA